MRKIPPQTEALDHAIFHTKPALEKQLHKPLHNCCPLLPNNHDFRHTPRFHPVENIRPTNRFSVCGTECRGFKPRLPPQSFTTENKVLRDSASLFRKGGHCTIIAHWLSVEGHTVQAKRPERIERIPRRNHHTVARAQVLLSDLLKGTRVVGNCFQRLGDAGQVSSLKMDVAPL